MEERRSVRRLGHAALAALAFAGCRDVLGVTGYGVRPSDAGAGLRSEAGRSREVGTSYSSTCGGTAYASGACGACMDRACCSEASACALDPGCRALSTCLGQCGSDDAACRVVCNLSIRRTTAMSELMKCAADGCPRCAAAHATYGGLTCERCLEATDPGDLDRLSHSVAALELDSCQADCPPSYRTECRCDDVYPQGEGEGRDVLDALNESCATECQDPDWSCLGSVQYAGIPSDQKELVLHVGVAEVPLLAPLRNAEVSPCSAADDLCAMPGVPTAVGADGFVLLRLSRQGTGSGALPFFGALQVNWTDADGGGPSNVLLYFFPSMSRSPSWTWRRLVPRWLAQRDVESALPVKVDWAVQGGVVWSAATCNGLAAENLVATLDSGDHPYYLDDLWLIDTGLQQTSTSGLGAFVNPLPGRRVLTLELADSHRKVGSYKFTVRPGTITTLSLTPSGDSGP